MRRAMSVVVLVAAVSAGVVGVVWAADAQVGTWKLNVAKSTYSPGPAPKSATLKIEAADGGVKVTLDQVPGTGNPIHYDYTAKYDGKDYKQNGNPNADMVSYKKIDDNTFEVVAKKDGKVVTTSKVVYSKDGKTRTNTQVGTNAQGQKLNNVVVYERQP